MGVVNSVIRVTQIVAAVVGMFNMDTLEERKLNDYVKLQQMQWIEKRKDDSEVQSLITQEAERITGR